jgi:hypothetical protein
VGTLNLSIPIIFSDTGGDYAWIQIAYRLVLSTLLPNSFLFIKICKMSHPQRLDREPSTLSNYYDLVTRHIAWTYEADFSRKVLKGHVVLTLEALVDNVQEVVVDSRDLTITKVSQDGADLKVKESIYFGHYILNLFQIYPLQSF